MKVKVPGLTPGKHGFHLVSKIIAKLLSICLIWMYQRLAMKCWCFGMRAIGLYALSSCIPNGKQGHYFGPNGELSCEFSSLLPHGRKL